MKTDISKELIFRNSVENLQSARTFVEDFLDQTVFSDTWRSRLILAVDEALSWIIRNAEKTGNAGKYDVKLELDYNSSCFKVTITNDENSFDSGDISIRDIALLRKEAESQRLGTLLMNSIMDEVNYTYHKGLENKLNLTKFTP